MQKLFSQAFILAGSPCSGKSTIAERLSNEFRITCYKVDDHEEEHKKRCQPLRHPTMFKYSQMSWSEIWERPVSIQVQEVFEYYRERFEMIVEDLKKFDVEKPLILEGAAFLPELLEQNNANLNRVMFLVPTKEFQLFHYSRRNWINKILLKCKNPDEAFNNWMKRDYQFGRKILNDAKNKNYATIQIDGNKNVDEIYDQVKTFFNLKIE